MKITSLKLQYEYILDCINNEEETLTTAKEKLSYFVDRFNAEFNYDYNKRTYPNIQQRISQYLQGLPSCCKVAFCDYDIAQIGKSWGYCQTERKEREFINNWFSCMAFRIMQLCKKNGINF